MFRLFDMITIVHYLLLCPVITVSYYNVITDFLKGLYFSVTVFHAMHFQYYFPLYIVAVCFIDGGNQEKTTDLPQVTDKLLSHNVVSSIPRLSGIRIHNVIGDRHFFLNYVQHSIKIKRRYLI